MKKKIQILCVGLITLNLQLITHNSLSQNVSINNDGTNADANTMLDVKSAGATSATFGLKIKDSAGNNQLVVRSDGNVGIGTTSPGRTLDIEGPRNTSYRNLLNIRDNSNFGPGVGGGLGFVGKIDGAGTYANGGAIWTEKVFSTSGDASFSMKFGTRLDGTSNIGADITIDHEGMVGVGTTAPDHRLHVRHDNDNGYVSVFQNASSAVGSGGGNGPGAISLYRGNNNGASNFFLYVGLLNGGVQPLGGLQPGHAVYMGHGGVSGMSIGLMGNSPIRFYTNNTEQVRVDPNGNVGIGTTTPSYKLEVCGTIGTTAVAVTTGITCSSDIRFKKNVEPLMGTLNKVKEIRGVTYKWKEEEFPEKNFNSKTQIGVIAQELERVYPELVHTDKEGYKSVDYSHITPILIEAIKEQQQIIENQQEEIGSLRAEMNKKDKETDLRFLQLEEYLKTTNK